MHVVDEGYTWLVADLVTSIHLLTIANTYGVA